MKNITFLNRLESGLIFFEKFIKYPDGKLTTELDKSYPIVHDYILFLQGLQIPFYSNLRARLREHDCITRLFEHLLNKQSDIKVFLMPNEAYDFLFSLKTIFGLNFIKFILETYNKIPYNLFSHILRTLSNNGNKKEFVEIIENIDCTELMKALWLLRLVLYGVNKVDDKLLTPLGFASSFYEPSNFFFRNYQNHYNKDYIEASIRTFLDNIYNYDLFEQNSLLSYSSLDLDGELKEKGICEFKKDFGQIIAFHSENFPLNKRDFVSSTFSNEFQIPIYCKHFILSALYSHEKFFHEILDKSYIYKLETINNDFSHSESIFDDITVETYIYKYLMKISITYNVVKEFFDPTYNNFMLRIFDRFPIFKEAITGINSLYNKYFENVFGTGLVDATNKTSKKDNCTHDSDISEPIEEGEMSCFPKVDRRSPFIMGKLNKYENFGNLFNDVLHHLYLYLKADEKQESIDELLKNKKAYIDSDEADFINILGGKLKDGEKVNKNPTINWIGKQNEYYAFVYSYFGGNQNAKKECIYDTEFKNTINPGAAPFTYCFLHNKIHKKLSGMKDRDAKNEQDLKNAWMERFEKICNYVIENR